MKNDEIIVDNYINNSNSNKLNNEYDITGEILDNVYTNNGDIEEIKYDFSDLMDELEEFTINIKINNYNNAGNVKIPSVVITSPTDF